MHQPLELISARPTGLENRFTRGTVSPGKYRESRVILGDPNYRDSEMMGIRL